MANEIKLKRGSGSDPSASDLVVGEIAIRTDTGKLFTKKDDNSVAEISGGGIDDGDKGDITVSSSGATFTIDNGVISTAKIADDAVNSDKLASGLLLSAGTNKNIRFSGGIGEIGSVTGFQAVNDAESANTDFGIRATTIRLATGSAERLRVKDAGIDVTGNIAVSGTVDGRDVATDGSKLDGIASGATNVTNTNQLTNGAGFITATLTNEQVQDIVGGMLTGNTETGITVTYQDGDGTIDFVVGTLNQDTTGNAATATALETARNIGGVSFNGTGNINLPGVNTSGNQNTSGNAATATKLATARTIAGVSFDGSANISLNNNAITNGAGYITSADGGNAATLDGIDSASFARSDASDTMSGDYTFSSSSQDVINLSANSTNDNRGIAFNSRTAISADYNDGYLRLNNNSEFSNGVYTPLVMRADGGFNVDGTMSIDGSGNIVASKVPTLNQNTTGSSGSCTGNAATATQLANARTIAGVSFNGTANISLNNNAITNGAGYVTSSVINSLNASNLSSGTIPDARFPSTLPAVDGSNLTGISAGATGGGSDEVFYENDQTVTTNYTITNGKNAMSAGPITINSGVTVTVGSGETLTIV